MDNVITINDLEQYVQNGLEALRNVPFNEEIRKALNLLTPEGYRAIAQFEEDGRKKRGTSPASNWNPATGEIVIYFEPLAKAVRVTAPPQLPAPAIQPVNAAAPKADQFQQCCQALAEAETGWTPVYCIEMVSRYGPAKCWV